MSTSPSNVSYARIRLAGAYQLIVDEHMPGPISGIIIAIGGPYYGEDAYAGRMIEAGYSYGRTRR